MVIKSLARFKTRLGVQAVPQTIYLETYMNTCFICKNSYQKGIGICCSRQCHNKRINTRSRDNDCHVLLRKQKILAYESNPKLCMKCHQPLTWDQRTNKFCSSSCNALVNNYTRDASARIKQRETLLRTWCRIERPRRLYCKVKFSLCATCDSAFRVKSNQKLYCSSNCRFSSNIKTYRRACKFKISKTLNPELFKTQLLEQYGWYRAANHPKGYNPKGATWDHLFRVEDGYKLAVDPKIMSHPANAEMISWEENFARKKSSITLDELLARIAAWKK